MFTISGLFALTKGSHEVLKTATSTRTYTLYNTVLCCSSGELFRAQLRIFGGHAPLPHGTIVFAHAKVHASIAGVPASPPKPGKPEIIILLEVMMMKEIGGDPTSPDYEIYAPDMPVGFVHCSGAVQSTGEVAEFDRRSKAFTLQVTDYVRDDQKSSLIRFAISDPCSSSI